MVVIHPPRESHDQYYDPRATDYSQAYNEILKKARCASFSRSASSSTNAAVCVLVSPDPDALCAARLLTRLLTEDDIPHRIVPVDGYTALQNIIDEDVVGNEEVGATTRGSYGELTDLLNALDSFIPSYF